MLHATFGMYHAENVKVFKLYVVKNVRIIFYKIIYIYININVKKIFVKRNLENTIGSYSLLKYFNVNVSVIY
jgi:hypothetical protein